MKMTTENEYSETEKVDVPDKAASVFPSAIKTVLCISMQKSAEKQKSVYQNETC